MRTLGLIPARCGSRRVPHKNVKCLGGKPLIAWTIEAALCAGSLDSVVVSTNDQDVVKAAQDWGAYVYGRPDFLATDTASSYDVVRYVLKQWSPGDQFTHVMLLQPTSPFRTADDIDAVSALNWTCASYERGKDVPNGAIYMAVTSLWCDRSFNFDTSPDIRRYKMPAERSIDIDTPEDWARAEEMVKCMY